MGQYVWHFVTYFPNMVKHLWIFFYLTLAIFLKMY